MTDVRRGPSRYCDPAETTRNYQWAHLAWPPDDFRTKASSLL